MQGAQGHEDAHADQAPDQIADGDACGALLTHGAAPTLRQTDRRTGRDGRTGEPGAENAAARRCLPRSPAPPRNATSAFARRLLTGSVGEWCGGRAPPFVLLTTMRAAAGISSGRRCRTGIRWRSAGRPGAGPGCSPGCVARDPCTRCSSAGCGTHTHTHGSGRAPLAHTQHTQLTSSTSAVRSLASVWSHASDPGWPLRPARSPCTRAG